MRPNPKFHVDEEQWALWLRELSVIPVLDHDWEVTVRQGERRVVPEGIGRPIARVHFGEKWLLLRMDRDPALDPTSISWLSDLCEKFPETASYELYRHAHGEEEGAEWVGSQRHGGEPARKLGEGFQGSVVAVGRLGDFCARVAEVVERTPTYDEPEEEGAEPLVEHRYRRVAGPEDIPWYHATRAAFVESIMRDGLRTRADLRALGGEHESGYAGWSPGWNMGIRDAVYLTADPEYAARIAETLAVRNEEDSVILEVDGKALDTSKIGVDEDALQDEFHGPSSSFADPDFPEYWTSLSSRIRSIAYLGRIAPEHIKVVAFGRYKQERYFDEYRGHEVVDEDFEIEPVDDEETARVG